MALKVTEIRELTGLRFFAAFHVVLFHQIFLLGTATEDLPQWVRNVISHGDAAVTLFFILSGFILSYVYIEKEELRCNSKTFFRARLSRIYPLYLLGIVMDLPRGIMQFLSDNTLGIAWAKIIFSLTGHLTMLQSWIPRITPSWNPPGWSLSTEMFFYLAFPFIAPKIFRLKKLSFLILFVWLVPAAIYLLLWRGSHLNLEEGQLATFWRSFPLLRLTDFIAGICLGKWFISKDGTAGKSTSVFFWLLLVFGIIAVAYNPDFPRGLWVRPVLLPVFSAMIIYLAKNKIYGRVFFTNPLSYALGNASYALYILHVPWLFYLNHLRELFGMGYGIGFFALYLTTSIFLSVFAYTYIEKPAQKYFRRP
jgi:peptidoglycan/LPS O-acetylase OafA/YrhL